MSPGLSSGVVTGILGVVYRLIPRSDLLNIAAIGLVPCTPVVLVSRYIDR